MCPHKEVALKDYSDYQYLSYLKTPEGELSIVSRVTASRLLITVVGMKLIDDVSQSGSNLLIFTRCVVY